MGSFTVQCSAVQCCVLLCCVASWEGWRTQKLSVSKGPNEQPGERAQCRRPLGKNGNGSGEWEWEFSDWLRLHGACCGVHALGGGDTRVASNGWSAPSWPLSVSVSVSASVSASVSTRECESNM
ncbi:hypothetical protein N431DRAFT_437899 [Stipitochalara longipes BDJ]|nr:hypothetical protein N431DRAFT_437899 [Stipitochalara longipes BDJ]